MNKYKPISDFTIRNEKEEEEGGERRRRLSGGTEGGVSGHEEN